MIGLRATAISHELQKTLNGGLIEVYNRERGENKNFFFYTQNLYPEWNTYANIPTQSEQVWLFERVFVAIEVPHRLEVFI